MTKRSRTLFVLVLAMLFLIGTTYAWFVMIQNSEIDPIVINVGKMEANYEFYVGNDSNRDGILEPISGTILYQKVDKLEYKDVIPGDIFSFRIDVTSLTDFTDVKYSFKINREEFLKSFNNDEKILDMFLLSFGENEDFITINNFFKSYDGYFFKSKNIEYNELQSFYFKLKISENLSNNYQGLVLEIKKLEIYFEQRE